MGEEDARRRGCPKESPGCAVRAASNNKCEGHLQVPEISSASGGIGGEGKGD